MRVQGHNPETETQPYAPTSPPKVVLTSPFQVRETAGICNKPFSQAAGICNKPFSQAAGICISQLEKKSSPYMPSNLIKVTC